MKTCLLAILAIPSFSLPILADTPADSAEAIGPKPTYVVEPDYPEEARLEGVRGAVMIECLVDVEGNVVATGTVEKKTDPRLKEAALAAVSQWKFEPLHGEQAAEGFALVRIPVNFELTAHPFELDTTRIATR